MASCFNVLTVFKTASRMNAIPLRYLFMNHKVFLSSLVVYEIPRTLCTSQIFHKRRKTAEEKNIMEYSPKAKGEVVDVWANITVAELARVLNRDVTYIYDLFLGTINGRNTVITDLKELQNAIRRSGKRMRIIAKPIATVEKNQDLDAVPRPPPVKSELKPRPPIVTVMGHVDHGKTTLLDALRHSSVVDQEFGGITQHIGAFSVKLQSDARITFLDTPGHAAFSAMRARGANITDIVVLVVAADDGVMEQTVECIQMAKQTNVPILVAINKIDSPKADVKRTEEMLAERGIQVENLGGDVQAVHISALKRTNLDQLTEALVLQSELMEIGADQTGLVEAVVVESRVDLHKGRLCTVIVQRGILKRGAILVADTAMAKVRLLRDASGQILDHVLPGYPAEIEGWKDLPPAGEIVLQVESEKRARAVCRLREDRKKEEKLQKDATVIKLKEDKHRQEYEEKLQLRRRLGRFKLRNQGPRKPEISPDDDSPRLNLIIKSDVDGTLEAILETLSTYNSDQCALDIINYGVGAITENDVELAQAFKGIIYAFNVQCPSQVQEQANESDVAVKHYNVIYKLVDAIKEDINVRLPESPVEEILGEAVVLQQFLINEGRKKVPVAGCRCQKGQLKRGALFRIIRNGKIIHDGPLTSMRYLKAEVDTIKIDSDCGLQFADKTVTFEVGDIIVCYESSMQPQIVEWDPGF